MLILNIAHEDLLISKSERRYLKSFPEFTMESLLDGTFATNFESYALDQFAYREFFRSLRAKSDLSVLHKKDVNDLFLYNGTLIKLEYPYNEKNVIHFNDYIEKIKLNYLMNANVYLTIIPDKAFFVKDSNYPKVDYDALELLVTSSLDEIDYIDIFDALSLEDYYKTDTHWKQEKLPPIANIIASHMGIEKDFTAIDYTENIFTDFYGVYHGQSALNLPPEQLTYLTSDAMLNVSIKNYQYLDNNDLAIYETSLLNSMDPYDVFLSGASPLIEITNHKSSTDKELLLFRDSFASSFAPLLLNYYGKITLIDTRYVSYQSLDQFVDFNNQDVLFMYSTMIINNSQTLK